MNVQPPQTLNGLEQLAGDSGKGKSARHRSRRKWIVALCLPACFGFWFLTAPACFSIERIAAGNNFSSRLIIDAAETYESPMAWLCRRSTIVRRYDDYMSDWWFEVLDAPDTTP